MIVVSILSIHLEGKKISSTREGLILEKILGRLEIRALA